MENKLMFALILSVCFMAGCEAIREWQNEKTARTAIENGYESCDSLMRSYCKGE